MSVCPRTGGSWESCGQRALPGLHSTADACAAALSEPIGTEPIEFPGPVRQARGARGGRSFSAHPGGEFIHPILNELALAGLRTKPSTSSLPPGSIGPPGLKRWKGSWARTS